MRLICSTPIRFWPGCPDFHVPGRGDVGIETIAAGSVPGWSWLFPPYQWQFGAVVVERTLMTGSTRPAPGG